MSDMKQKVKERIHKLKPRVKIVKHEDIVEGERAREEYGDLKALTLSIATHGLIQPLAVEELEEGKYYLLAGGRRYRAMAELKGIKIPVRVYGSGLDNRERKIIELEENLRREDLTYQEQCKLTKEIHNALASLLSNKGKKHSMRDTAKMLNVDVGTVSKDITLATAMEVVPILAEQKNKNDANKMLKKMEEKADIQKIAKELRSEKAKTPEKKAKSELMDAYLVSDFFKGVKNIPDSSVGFLEIDPDWAIGFKRNRKEKDTEVDNYEEVEQEQFIKFAKKIADEAYRVMKEGSWGVLFHGSEWSNILYELFLHKGFFVEKYPALWIKDKGGNRNPDIRLSKAYEQFLYFRIGQARLSSDKLGRSTNFEFRQPPNQSRIHPTEKPIELCEEILNTFIGNTKREFVLSCFAGSGNWLLASHNLGHLALGFDTSQAYKDKYTVRVANGKLRQYKSLTEKKEKRND